MPEKISVWVMHDFHTGYYEFSDVPIHDFVEVKMTARQRDELTMARLKYDNAQQWLLRATGKKVPHLSGREGEPEVNDEWVPE